MNKIVIAEASPTIRSVADSLLRQNGYNVLCASDGLQAWEMIQAEKPDLIFAGFGLTSLSGLELCKQVAKDQVTGGIPVIILIGAKDHISNEDIFSCGARGQLKKPFSPKELLEMVRKMTGEQEKIPEFVDNNRLPEDNSGMKADIFSNATQGIPQSANSYTLDWSDLEDIKSKTTRSVDIKNAAPHGEEHSLEIDEDQYGLVKSPEEIRQENLAVANQVKKEEDFGWFMDEIKKEITGEIEKDVYDRGQQSNVPFAPQRETTAAPPPRSPQAYSEFEELLAGFNEISKPVENMAPGRGFDMADSRPQTVLAGPAPAAPGRSLSDEDIESLAERVAAKIAASLLTQIDRNKIVEAIKSELK